jgi:hypothetical protein
MAGALGVGDEVDDQRVAICPLRRPIAELVAPQPERSTGAQLLRRQTDYVWTLAGPADELEVGQPDLSER